MRRDKRKASKNRSTGSLGPNPTGNRGEQQTATEQCEATNAEKNSACDKSRLPVPADIQTPHHNTDRQKQSEDCSSAQDAVCSDSESCNQQERSEGTGGGKKHVGHDVEQPGARTQSATDNHVDSDVANGQCESTSVDSISTNDVASKFYSSLNLLATRAFFNVKLEPVEVSVAEKCGLDYLSSLEKKQAMKNFPDQNTTLSENGSPLPQEPELRCISSRGELSPHTFAEQLRHNDSASMVVCRPLATKTTNQTPEILNAAGGRANGSSLHHFVTRYTVEKTDDSSRLGLDICLESNDSNEAIMEVECGGNKGLLYVTKLCQGSKGQSILFNDEWLTPNEFQFISGRETAKDWKRSIRHCGKSLKTLMTKGVLQVHPPVCECDYCKGQPATKSENAKPNPAMQRDTSLCADDTNGKPLSLVLTDASTSSSRQGREGGLNSIISQLHNKKASIRCDASSPNGQESLDLRVNSSTNGSGSRKRRTNSTHNEYISDDDEMQSVSSPKKSFSDAEEHYRSQDRDAKNQVPQKRIHSHPFWNNEKQPHSSNHLSQWLGSGENGYRTFPRPGFGYSEYALYDAMKRAVANGYCTPPPPINLPGGVKQQPMVELTSPRSKNMDKKLPTFYGDWDYHKPLNEQMATFDETLPFSQGNYFNRFDSHSKSPQPDTNNNCLGLYSSRLESAFEYAGKRNSLKGDKRSKSAKLLSSISNKTRSRGSHKQSGQQKMVNLHNHAIPMMSLTYKNKRKEKTHNSNHSSRSCKRSTDSSPPALTSSSSQTAHQRQLEGPISKAGDMLRRLSSSAPPSQVHLISRNSTSPTSKSLSKDFEFHGGGKFANSFQSSSGLSPTSSASVFGDLPVDLRANEMLHRKAILAALEEMGQWSIDAVCKFLEEVGCAQYEEVFREHQIDGDALPLLVERHLVEKMGLKLGHALKLIARVHRRLGTHLPLITNHHCSAAFAHCFCGVHVTEEASQHITHKNGEFTS